MVCASVRKSSQTTRPTADCARNPKAEKNKKNPLRGVVCLLTTRGLIGVRRVYHLGGACALYVPSSGGASRGIWSAWSSGRSRRSLGRPAACFGTARHVVAKTQ